MDSDTRRHFWWLLIHTSCIFYVGCTQLISLEQVAIILMVWLVWFMVLNAAFNNIPVISWRSFLLVEETGTPAKNH